MQALWFNSALGEATIGCEFHSILYGTSIPTDPFIPLVMSLLPGVCSGVLFRPPRGFVTQWEPFRSRAGLIMLSCLCLFHHFSINVLPLLWLSRLHGFIISLFVCFKHVVIVNNPDLHWLLCYRSWVCTGCFCNQAVISVSWYFILVLFCAMPFKFTKTSYYSNVMIAKCMVLQVGITGTDGHSCCEVHVCPACRCCLLFCLIFIYKSDVSLLGKHIYLVL